MQARFELVDVRCEDGIAVVAMNRPDKRNAMNLRLLEQLALALTDAQQDSRIAAVILTGHGPAFSAGADRSPVAGLTGDALARAFATFAEDLAHGVAQVMLRLVSMTKPVIGALNGHAVGGAFIVALGCDLRVVSQDALFWMPELGMGRAIGAPSMATLVACVGPLVAKDIVLTGRRLPASELAALGLVSRVEPPGEVMDVARSTARRLGNADAHAFATAKARANEGLVTIWRAALEHPESDAG